MVNGFSNESCRTQSQLGQNALIQKGFLQEAIQKLGETVEGMDAENKLKDNIANFSAY